MIIRRNTCLLCRRELEAFEDGSGRQLHPEAIDCEVIYADAWGVPIDIIEMEADVVEDETPVAYDDDLLAQIRRWPLVEDVLTEIFTSFGMERLGGASTGRGWTSFSIWQRCRYAWRKRYIDKPDTDFLDVGGEPEARAVGTLMHAFLAVHYSRDLDDRFKALTPQVLHDGLIVKANPKLVTKAWNAFQGYVLTYKYESEWLRPLAVEYDLKDPRTGESCRFDLIAQVLEPHGALQAGVYDFEHKTSGRFDAATLAWQNDGEVLGQIMLWQRLRLELRFGKLMGACVNLIGTQEKEQKFERIVVAPSAFRLDSHARDLRYHDADIKHAIAYGIFPRSRGGCINRYGLCDYYDHCASADD